MARIQSGQEAASIQAEAKIRAEAIRAEALKAARAQYDSLEMAHSIQKEAMIKARRDSLLANREADLADQDKNSARWSSIWYEAYQNYRSKASAASAQTNMEIEIAEEAKKVVEERKKVAELKKMVSIARSKLEFGIEQQKKAEAALDIQVEVQHRHRLAIEHARKEAEKKAREEAIAAAQLIQQKADALARVTAEKMNVHVEAMKATRAWAEEQKTMRREKQEMLAKQEAQKIQAEAKARARVAGEASII